LHSFGVNETQILWKKNCQKNQDGGSNDFFQSRDLRPKKKLLQFIQRITKKKLARIGEPMVPNFGDLANIDPNKQKKEQKIDGLRIFFHFFKKILKKFRNSANFEKNQI
jgi:hypothetical protein